MMAPNDAASAAQPLAGGHLVGKHGGTSDGPLMLVSGGIHGNEPSGIYALRRVFAYLERTESLFHGTLVGIAGNLAAIEQGERFLDEDLNRIWLPQRLESLRHPSWAPASAEQREQAELLATIDEVLATAVGTQIYFLDLHTSSAHGEPFVCIGDTLKNRRFAMQLPVPVILGLEEQLDGALLEYINNLGHVTVGVEAGKHEDPTSVDHHEAMIWLALRAAGCLQEHDLPDAAALRQRLRRAVGEVPPVMEVRYRHPITPGDGFRMRPGYVNFQPVEAGELLAVDNAGSIVAREQGRVLLPLYQGLGSDGFFVTRDVRPIWLRISRWLRRLRVGRIAHWLPGVQKTADPDTLIVDCRIARWLAVEVFHLLGFRKRRNGGGAFMFFSRRRQPLLGD